MLRIISICVSGVLLNTFLIGFFGWVLANYTEFGKWSEANVKKGRVLTEKETLKQFGKTPKEIFDTFEKFNNFLAFPIISILLGVFVGFLVNKYVLPITALSNVVTLFFFYPEIWIGLIYLSLSCVTSWIIFKYVRKVEN